MSKIGTIRLVKPIEPMHPLSVFHLMNLECKNTVDKNRLLEIGMTNYEFVQFLLHPERFPGLSLDLIFEPRFIPALHLFLSRTLKKNVQNSSSVSSSVSSRYLATPHEHAIILLRVLNKMNHRILTPEDFISSLSFALSNKKRFRSLFPKILLYDISSVRIYIETNPKELWSIFHAIIGDDYVIIHQEELAEILSFVLDKMIIPRVHS